MKRNRHFEWQSRKRQRLDREQRLTVARGRQNYFNSLYSLGQQLALPMDDHRVISLARQFNNIPLTGAGIGSALGAAAGSMVGFPQAGEMIGGFAGGELERYIMTPREMEEEMNEPTEQAAEPSTQKNTGMVWNKQAKKASMTVKNRKGAKLRGTKKEVYVPKKLRKQVKEVLQDQKAYGALYLKDQCHIGFYQVENIPGLNAGAKQVTTQHSLSNQILTVLPPYESNFSCQWWGCGASAGNSVGLILDNPIYNYKNWIYFTPKQLLDAASQLFNQKPVSPNYMANSGDFVTTGTPGGAQATTFKQQGFKLDVENSYVTYELRNNGARPVIVDFYHCVPKIKWSFQTPLSDFWDAANTQINSIRTPITHGTRLYVPAVVESSTTDANSVPYYALCGGMIEPNQLPAFAEKWRYTKVSVLMQPGEICTHVIQGPKNYVMDFNKLYQGDDDYTNYLLKDTTVCVMAKVRTDMMYATAGVVPNANDATTNGQGSFTLNNKLNTMTQPITIQTTKTIKLRMPEITGGTIHTEGEVDDQMQLNSRVPRKVFIDNTDYKKSTLAYTYANEENPVATTNQVGIYG